MEDEGFESREDFENLVEVFRILKRWRDRQQREKDLYQSEEPIPQVS